MMATVSIRYCDIPAYLHAGKFYRNLDSSDPESSIEVPADCFRPDEELATGNANDFAQLLRTSQFWLLDEIPRGMLNFCSNYNIRPWLESNPDPLDKNSANALLVLKGECINNFMVLKSDFQAILETGHWEVLRHLIGRLDKEYSGYYATAAAAEIGDLQLLVYLHEEGFPMDEKTCDGACTSGSIECLRYAHEKGCTWKSEVQYLAARHGHLKCLKYVFDHDHVLDPHVCFEAAAAGHLDCLQFGHVNGGSLKGTLSAASKYGHLDCLRYALENNDNNAHPIGDNTHPCVVACTGGHLNCLQLLLEFGVPYDKHTLGWAATSGHTLCMQLLHENGCPWDDTPLHHATTTMMMQEGHYPALKYAIDHGCPYPSLLASCCFNTPGGLQCLQYLVEEQGLLMNEEVFLFALLRGDLPCVQYLIDQGCPYLDAELTQHHITSMLFKNCHYMKCENFALEQSVMCAIERGWKPNRCFVVFVAHNHPSIIELFIKEGFIRG